MVDATVGTAGGNGTAFMVTAATAGVEQELSAILRTRKVYIPGANEVNDSLAWYVVPLLILYSTPTCVVNTIVPTGTAQVGWVVDASVGAVGAPGAASIVTVAAAGVEQVLSAILRTLKV